MGKWQEIGLTFIRILLGLMMIYHGWEVFDSTKMNEYASWDVFSKETGKTMAYLGKTAELIGGIFLTLGLLTRVGAVLIMGTLFYITLFIGKGRLWMEDQHPFLFVLLALVFFILGGGKWSLDHFIFSKKKL